ncbi:MAG: hypothetical protein ABJ314_05515, partial [Ilumatobacter sp.]
MTPKRWIIAGAAATAAASITVGAISASDDGIDLNDRDLSIELSQPVDEEPLPTVDPSPESVDSPNESVEESIDSPYDSPDDPADPSPESVDSPNGSVEESIDSPYDSPDDPA